MWQLFIAKRIYRDNASEGKVSHLAVRIAMTGIAIGLVVMIVVVAVASGFKKEMRDKVIGFGSHIQIGNLNAIHSYEAYPVVTDDSILSALYEYREIAHIQRYSAIQGIIKTDDAFQSMILKGVGEEYDFSFFRKYLVEGEIPLFTDSTASNQVIISKSLASKLKLSLGDKLYTYYYRQEDTHARPRRLTVAAIYQTNFSEYDNLFLLTDIYTVNRLNNWNPDQATGLELQLKDYDKLEDMTVILGNEFINHADRYGSAYCVRNIKQLNLSIFAWLDLLNLNVLVVLILMTGVAGFTMISGLLILIIERTNMIGLLKALGATNYTIRKIFLWLSVFLIGKGMIWGNIIGLLLYFVQSRFKIFALDPESYYVDSIPMSFSVWAFIFLNIGTLLVSVLMLIMPSFLVSRINPATSMRYE
ncbi:Lipoprotein-releasing system transmembrane protein LolE [termite gut metagenome]|uniref:Lipoprotein-releasing system transmembrane protein LolE n=1 Tax=termite gut metagenome TaxID=433724 RepID=A0A5J4T0R0_9ZZZZ